MYERCLNEAERILATSGEIVLPIKRVWKQLTEEGKRRSFDVPSFTDFDALLDGDKRFEVISAQTDPEDLDALVSEDGEELDSNLGSLGFFPEDRVKLRRIKLPSRAATSEDEPQVSEEDEEMSPINVRGLSATKPVRAVEPKKNAAKKTTSPAARKRRSSTGSRSQKHSRKSPKARGGVRKALRRSR